MTLRAVRPTRAQSPAAAARGDRRTYSPWPPDAPATADRSPTPARRGSRMLSRLLLVVLAGVITLVEQGWVGRSTIYTDAARDRVRTAHLALLENHPPAGAPTWNAVGLNGTNVRVGAVLLAEGVHRVTGRDYAQIYRYVDSVALFLTLLLLPRLLRGVVPEPYPIAAVLLVGALLPLTYQLFYFHPWDRLSALAWLVVLLLVRARATLALALALPVAVAIKYDVLVVPGLFVLVHADRARWRMVAAQTAALFAVGIATLAALYALRPNGGTPHDVSRMIVHNLQQLRDFNVLHPPLLGFAVPLLLAAVGFGEADRFARACAVFGVLLFVPFFVQTNFAEFRAQVPILLCLLPAAMVGLRRVAESAEAASPGAASATAG